MSDVVPIARALPTDEMMTDEICARAYHLTRDRYAAPEREKIADFGWCCIPVDDSGYRV